MRSWWGFLLTVRPPRFFDEEWIDLQASFLERGEVDVPAQSAGDFRFLGDEHEDHAVFLEEAVAIGDGQDAGVLELGEDMGEARFFRGADEKHVAILYLLDGFKKFDGKAPGLDEFAFEIILQ